MKFKEVIILDWYDNIITAFCKSENDLIYYCNLLAINNENDDKVYVCIELKYFEESEALLNIIERKTYHKDEDELKKTLNTVMLNNKSFLIKTQDLKGNDLKIVKYKSDFNWNHNFFSIDYPRNLKISVRLDNWWKYF